MMKMKMKMQQCGVAPLQDAIVMMKMKSQMKRCGDGCTAQRMRVAPLKEAIVMMKMKIVMKQCGVMPLKEAIAMMKMKSQMKRTLWRRLHSATDARGAAEGGNCHDEDEDEDEAVWLGAAEGGHRHDEDEVADDALWRRLHSATDACGAAAGGHRHDEDEDRRCERGMNAELRDEDQPRLGLLVQLCDIVDDGGTFQRRTLVDRVMSDGQKSMMESGGIVHNARMESVLQGQRVNPNGVDVTDSCMDGAVNIENSVAQC